MKVDFEPDGEMPEAFDGVLAYALTTIGGWTFGALVKRPVIRDQRLGKRRELLMKSGEILSTIVTRSQGDCEAQLRDRYQSHLDRLAVNGEWLGTENLAALLGPKQVIPY
jgi:hypothetical protein